MWIDANHDGLLNQLDIRVFIDFASPGFQPGSINFGNLLGLFTGAQVTNYTNPILNPANSVDFSGTLAPGEFLFGGGPGGNDKLTLSDGNIANGIPIGFETLEIADGKFGTLSVNQWNGFSPQITGPGSNTVKFLDGIDASKGTSMQTIKAIENYDFSGLSYGITMTTPAFVALAAPFQDAGSVLGTAFDDTFNVNENDLKAGFTIDGGKGTDTLNVDVDLIFGDTFGQSGIAGICNAQVTGVEILNLVGPGPNTVGFNFDFIAFTTVNGGDGDDTIIEPGSLEVGWVLNLGGGANKVQRNGASRDLSQGTINVSGGGTVELVINAKGASIANTKMTFEEYQLFNATGITLLGGATFANTTILFSNAVTGGAVLNAAVGNWTLSSGNDTFTLGDLKQAVNMGLGGADTAILDIAGAYTGSLVASSADDTLSFKANVDISSPGFTSGFFGQATFNNLALSVVMRTDTHNNFAHPFGGTAGIQTITLTNGGYTPGDAGIENYFLVGGAGNGHTFQVYQDGGTLVGGKQNVTVTSGGAQDLIQYSHGTFTGNLTGLLIADNDIVELIGNADIQGVNGGAVTGAKTASFSAGNMSVTMTTAQHEGFAKPFINTGGTQAITLATSGAATGDAGIENYFLASGNDNFTVSTGLPSQNVDISSGNSDVIIYGGATFTGNLAGASGNDFVQFNGNANIAAVNGGGATGAGFASFSNLAITVTMTLLQHNGLGQAFLNTADKQTIALTTSGAATGDAGIEIYVLADGDDTFTIAKDNGVFDQSVNLFKGGADTVIFGTGTFTGFVTNADANDTFKFSGDADISGLNGFTVGGKANFSDSAVSVTMTLDQHNAFAQPFGGTTGTQTIKLTTSGSAVGDGGIENYILASGNDTFKVAPDKGGFKQSVDISSGGADLVQYGSPFSGNLVGASSDDTVQFLPGGGNVDISEVNGGAATGAGTANFSDADITVLMSVDQHNGFGTPFVDTDGKQTIVLATSGAATGDVGIENYVANGDGDYTFRFAADNSGLVGGSQNLDLVDSTVFNDTTVFGAGGTFSGALKHAGKGDTVRFVEGAADISALNGGAATGAEFVSFADGGMSATMAVAQHNAFQTPFKDTAAIQTITLTTDGAVTGDIGIEQYILGEDGTNKNVFTVGLISQSVTGRSDNDTVINNFGGVSGVLKGGSNTPTGDMLILGAANTTLAVGSGEFENLTLTALNGTITSDLAAHNGFSGVINTLGTNTYTVKDDAGGVLTGLAGFENYTFVSGSGLGFDFTLTNAQTGTITGIGACDDMFIATAAQVAGAVLIDGGDQTAADTLTITTDAGGLNLGTRTTGIETYILTSGSTSNVFGASGDLVLVLATGSTIFTMGSTGENQTYSGGVGALTGIDRVTLNVGSTSVATGDQNDTVTSLVGDGLTGVLDGGGGFDTLELTNDDSLVDGTVVGFENLVLANNASVLMNGTQYNQFTTNSAAPGVNTITVAPGPGGVGVTTGTFAGVESYIFLGGTSDHSYKVTGSGQTVTDFDTTGVNNATLVGTLDNVTITATSGVLYGVTALSGGTNLSVTTGQEDDVVQLGGGHTGVDVDQGGGNDTVEVMGGSVTGTIVAGLIFTPFDNRLFLHDTADISGVVVTNYGTLSFRDATTGVTMSAATWDQFVGKDGDYTAGHNVTSVGGTETVNLSSTVNNVTTAFSVLSDAIENYVLSSAANDFFRVNNASTGFHVNVDLSGGGSDFLILNDTNAAVVGNQDVHSTILNFAGGAGGDRLQVQLATNSISSGTAIIVTAMDTDVTTERTLIINSFAGATMDETWSQAEAQAAVGFAIDQIQADTYTVAVGFSGGGQSGVYVMAMTTAADNPGAAVYDLIGVLSNTNVNLLTGANFT
jgi:hypothetical protein